MSYEIYQFSSLVLPSWNSEDDVSAGRTDPVLLDLSGGGVYDVLGTEQAKRRGTPIAKSCVIRGASAADLRTQYNALRALNGHRGPLWRRWGTDTAEEAGDFEWTWGRLLDVQAKGKPYRTYSQPVELQFVMISAHWYGDYHGGPWLLDGSVLLGTGYYLGGDDTLPLVAVTQDFDLVNGGNRRVNNTVIHVTAGSAAITALSVIVTGVSELHYTGTIAAGKTLVIDCGGLGVVNNGVDDYAHFALGAGHVIDDWLRLEPGTTQVWVGMTGGGTGSTILFERYDGWE